MEQLQWPPFQFIFNSYGHKDYRKFGPRFTTAQIRLRPLGVSRVDYGGSRICGNPCTALPLSNPLTANGRKQIQPNRINKEYAMDSTWKRTQLCPINHCSGFCHDIIRILPGVVILVVILKYSEWILNGWDMDEEMMMNRHFRPFAIKIVVKPMLSPMYILALWPRNVKII